MTILSLLADLSRGVLSETATSLAKRLGYELAPVAQVAAYRQEVLWDLEDAAEDVARYYGALLTIARGPCGCIVRDPCDACLAANVIEWTPEEMPAESEVA